MFEAQSVIIPSDQTPINLTAGIDTGSQCKVIVRLQPTTSGGNGVFIGPETVAVNNGFRLTNDNSMSDGLAMNPQVELTLKDGETVWAAQFTGVQQIVDVIAFST